MTDALDIEVLLPRLASAGLSPELISATTGIDITTVRKTTAKGRYAPEDDEIAVLTRQLAARCLHEAFNILDHGHPTARREIIKIVLSKTAGLLGEETGSSLRESQESVSFLFEEMRTIRPIIEPTNALEPPPAPIAANDPRQRVAVDEDTVRPDPAFDRW